MALDTKEIPDTPPPITMEEVRDHKVMEHLIETHPELQEKGVGHAVAKAAREFKFTKSDWFNSIGFGAIFGTGFGAIGWGIGFGLEALGVPDFLHLKDFCGTFGVMLGAKSAVMHPFADMTKDFYDKCKDGWCEAKEHNKALGYLRQRLNAIKEYKQNYLTRGSREDSQSIVSTSLPIEAEEASYTAHERPRSAVVDAILAKKQEALSGLSWTERAQTQPTAQRYL